MAQKHPLPPIGAVLFLLLQAAGAAAQTQDSIAQLPPVDVRATALRQQHTGTFSEHFGTTQLSRYGHQSLADLLAAQTGTYVKSYGMGSLATLSLRGSSASQVAITWNGLPIQSPMLGLTDIALLPAFATDAVTLQHGSGGTAWGSGAVGGTLALSSVAPKRGLGGQYNGSVGSFGHQSHQAKLHWAGQKLALALRWADSRADNDFTYPLTDTIRRTQTNAHAAQQLLMPELYWQPTAQVRLSAHLWRQTNQRQIPPLTTQTRSLAAQADSVWRMVLQGHFFLKNHVFDVKSAYFNEKIFYQDPSILLKAPSEFERKWVEIEDRWHPARTHWTLQMGAQAAHYRATANGYTQGRTEHRQALFAHARYDFARVQVQASLRQEWQDDRAVPIVPAVGAEWRQDSVLQLRAKFDRSYRLPTLNDRFWNPGGNPDLRPEQGWGGETGITYTPTHVLRYTATAHARRVNDWILWSIAEGQPFFSSNNITAVRSYGLEQRLHGRWPLGHHWSFDYAVGADYVRSTVLKAVLKPNFAEGSQLPYTPTWRATAQMGIGQKQWHMGWNAQFTGATEGFNEPLPAFWVHDLRAEWSLGGTKWGGTAHLQVNNLFNRPYQVIERRPMPGRWFMAGFTAYFSRYNAD
jgi:vitamin B12 transporter